MLHVSLQWLYRYRSVIHAAMAELEATQFNTATHGGMALITGVINVLDSLLPGERYLVVFLWGQGGKK